MLRIFFIIFLGISLFSSGCAIKHQAKAHYYLTAEKYEQGIESFKEEIKKNPNDAGANYYMGRFCLANKNYTDGVVYLRQAVALRPESADYHFWLGVAHAANNRSDLEKKSYLNALHIDRNNIQAMAYLGHNRYENAEFDKALNTYRRVLKIWPEHPSALFNRALIMGQFGRTPEERLAWKEYLAVYPSGARGRQAAVHLNETGDFEYRNYLIGSRTITLEKIWFEPFTDKIGRYSEPSLEMLGSILKNNPEIAIHIVAYQKNNIKLAKIRAISIKKYLLKKYPQIQSSRLLVSWFGVPEKIVIKNKPHFENESIRFITAVNMTKPSRIIAYKMP
jgi:tetratricopeptide (TPR) repeat protein